MDSSTATMQMGPQPFAGRVRAMQVCESGRYVAAQGHHVSQGNWQLGHAIAGAAISATKPATRKFVDVPDTRTRRSRGTP